MPATLSEKIAFSGMRMLQFFIGIFEGFYLDINQFTNDF